VTCRSFCGKHEEADRASSRSERQNEEVVALERMAVEAEGRPVGGKNSLQVILTQGLTSGSSKLQPVIFREKQGNLPGSKRVRQRGHDDGQEHIERLVLDEEV
jgi:hypothetical protein